jgi:hypothetical protein
MSSQHSRLIPRSALAAFSLAGAAALAGCYVIPLDPATGQPYAAPLRPSAAPAGIVVVPPAPAAPQPSVMTARLYPLNSSANKAGLLTAVVVDSHTGRGSFTLSYLGDTLQGEATRVDASYAAFGRVHNEALGVTHRGFSGRRGIANAFGGKGINVQCEYLITGPAMGTGACVLSDGAAYQLHFGG